MTTPVSPKVTAAAAVAFVASLLLPNLELVTPEMLHLGPWSPFFYAVAVSGITAAAGWFVRDPLRDPEPLPDASGRHEATP